MESPTKERRGFAAMSQEKQREISRKGGKAAHEKGTAHKFDSEEARRAGRLGGEAVSQDRTHMATIGARGGQSRGQHIAMRASLANPATATSQPPISTTPASPAPESRPQEAYSSSPLTATAHQQ